jgi:hypothetical protein
VTFGTRADPPGPQPAPRRLMRDTLCATGLKTKRTALEEACEPLLSLKRLTRIRRLRGKVDWHGDLNAMRRDN